MPGVREFIRDAKPRIENKILIRLYYTSPDAAFCTVGVVALSGSSIALLCILLLCILLLCILLLCILLPGAGERSIGAAGPSVRLRCPPCRKERSPRLARRTCASTARSSSVDGAKSGVTSRTKSL